MRAFVFTDDRLHRDAGRFVWLAINSENGKNGAFLKKYPIPALPSYLVIDPNEEKAVMRWVGGASVDQLEKFFDDAEKTFHAKTDGTGPEAALARADRAYGDENHEAAVRSYREALALAPANWPSRARVYDALFWSLSQLDSSAATLALAQQVAPQYRGTSTGVGAVSSGLDAAIALPDSDARKKVLTAQFEAELRKQLADPSIPLSGDERSSYLATLIDARKAANDSIGAHQAAEDWVAFLEKAAKEAKTREQRASFDPHRLAAYIEVGQPEKAIPMLEQSEKEFPDDYNPSARLAAAYLNMKEYDKALAANDRAMAKAYGPRKLRIYMTRADIYAGKGDTESAKKTLEEAIHYADALPDGQRSDNWNKTLQKRIDKLTQTSAVH
jgi:Tfp pilus assembly protein PilF